VSFTSFSSPFGTFPSGDARRLIFVPPNDRSVLFFGLVVLVLSAVASVAGFAVARLVVVATCNKLLVVVVRGRRRDRV
jgi:hypothetical protein